MTKKEAERNQVEEPRYTYSEIMVLLNVDERSLRKMLVDAGVDVDPSKNNPGEKIAYADYRKLWISRANRPDGRLLAKLLVEESDSWFGKWFKA